MATVTPDLDREVTQLKKRIERIESMRNSVTAPPPPLPKAATIPTWLAVVNVGTILTLVLAVAGFAYYLGGLNNTVASANQRLEKIEAAVTGTSRDSVASRLSVIETKLDEISSKLDRR